MFIHWSVDGHLGSFLLLAHVNNSARSKYFFKFLLLVLLGTYLEVDALGHMVIPNLPLGGSAIPFSTVAGPPHGTLQQGGEGKWDRFRGGSMHVPWRCWGAAGTQTSSLLPTFSQAASVCSHLWSPWVLVPALCHPVGGLPGLAGTSTTCMHGWPGLLRDGDGPRAHLCAEG